MSKSISVDQSHAIIAALATNVDWTRLDGDLLQEGILKNPKEAGEHFNRFLENGARMPMVGDFKIAPVPFDPVGFIGKDWKVVSEEEDERSAKLTEVDFSKAKFVHCLKEGGTLITGEEKLRRLKQSKDIRLGAPYFMALRQDYQIKKENSVLERLYRAGFIKDYLDFFGTILLGSFCRRFVLFLGRFDGGEWNCRVRWLGDDWGVEYLSVVLPQV